MPQRSEFLWGWFLWYLRGYLRKNFHALRLSRANPLPDLAGQPLVFVMNHPSWWDPLVAILLTPRFPAYKAFAPLDAEMLKKYPMFGKLGMFGVEQNTARGAVQFLRTSLNLLAQPGHAIWITAQGRFADVRERPLVLKPGVAHLAARMTTGVLLPLAIEYPFWNERFPEALARFGEPLIIEPGIATDTWLARITQALEATQDALRDEAMSRDPEKFETLLGGSVGVGGVYDWWRRWKAWLRGERFSAAHDKENAT